MTGTEVHDDRTGDGSDVERVSLIRRILHLCFPTAGAVVVFLLTVVIAPVVLLSVHIHQSPQFSPIDEINHYDYVTRVAGGSIPRIGDQIQPASLQMLECNGIALPTARVPPCGTPLGPKVKVALADELPQFEAQQPPGYYILTVPMRWAAISLFGVSDPTATRMSGIVWLLVGLAILWVACRIVRLPPLRIGAGVLLVATSPLVIYIGSHVTNDAASIFAGSLVLLVGALAWTRPGRWRAPVLALVSFGVVLLKAVDVLPVIALSILFALESVSIGRRQGSVDGDLVPGSGEAEAPKQAGGSAAIRRWLPTGGALLAGGVLSLVTWAAVSHGRAYIDPASIATWHVLRTAPNGITDILREAVSMLTPLTGSFDPLRSSSHALIDEPIRIQNLAYVLSAALVYALAAGAAGGFFVSTRRWYHWMGLVSIPVLYLGGVALGYAIHWSYNVDPSVSGRYGLAMAPLLIVALVASVRGRWVVGLLWCLGVAAFAFSLAAMLIR